VASIWQMDNGERMLEFTPHLLFPALDSCALVSASTTLLTVQDIKKNFVGWAQNQRLLLPLGVVENIIPFDQALCFQMVLNVADCQQKIDFLTTNGLVYRIVNGDALSNDVGLGCCFVLISHDQGNLAILMDSVSYSNQPYQYEDGQIVPWNQIDGQQLLGGQEGSILLLDRNAFTVFFQNYYNSISHNLLSSI
jgi:hypothetical protein